MNGRLAFGLMALALTTACGVRTSLRPNDAVIDDDPWLKGDAAPDVRRAGTPVSDGGAAADGPRTAAVGPEGAIRALREIAKVLWQSDPDARHLALAQSGQIRTSADLEGIVREMLRDMRARRGVGQFYRWWLHLDDLGRLTKDPQQFPLFPKVATALADEVERFAVGVTLSDGLFTTLMTASPPYEDMQVTALVGDDGTDRARRAGLLARPGLLALHARADRPSPAARGFFVRQDVLCASLPAHPPGIDTAVPPQPANLTNRQHFQSLIGSPSCAACHELIDPLGYAFENYDAVGRFRAADHGQLVDASGLMTGTSNGPFKFVGAVQLGNILTSTREAWACVVNKWVHYLRGAAPASDDLLAARAGAAFERTGGDLREVIVTVLGATPL